eukprot:6198469-Pleurochrysis_carterae.AAC.2
MRQASSGSGVSAAPRQSPPASQQRGVAFPRTDVLGFINIDYKELRQSLRRSAHTHKQRSHI